ncbi:MAG: redox-sensitive transcriptional activator SoxR [Marinicaulis sp.]|nr:redox-sensitive transcriptional activator SoxR [Marinicaulis sp.]NNE39568.1 redox-sensitive transcriptional activator SoxR [Marinicaulis sp.]NNL88923.1 redox-sensitive transcriptional activator SoxR [Marinicaulis sp.]
MAKKLEVWIAIGDLAVRTGVAVSALRFYEEKGLIHARRNEGGQRRFLKSDIRRVSFILIAQRLGFSLEEIGAQLNGLPDDRTPTKKDWQNISKGFRKEIDARINALSLMREKLTGCIGCGCLSLKTCGLYNPGDEAAAKGAGPRYLMGDKPKRANL